jgi:hyperosmotically inducible protein
VAEALAERLNYPCISREMVIEDAAKEFDVPEDQINTVMVEKPGFWSQDSIKCIAYANFVRVALLKRAQENAMVFHGYGGHLLLSGASRVLRARIIAGMDYRIKVAMEKHNLDRRKVIAMIEELDNNRIKWVKTVLGLKWGEPSLYDVIFNLDRISISGVVDTLIQMKEMPEFKPDDDSRQELADLLLNSRIWAMLSKNKMTRAARVRVESNKGYVTLTGDVGSHKLLDAVVETAKLVDGVEAVSCNVGVGSSWIW